MTKVVKERGMLFLLAIVVVYWLASNIVLRYVKEVKNAPEHKSVVTELKLPEETDTITKSVEKASPIVHTERTNDLIKGSFRKDRKVMSRLNELLSKYNTKQITTIEHVAYDAWYYGKEEGSIAVYLRLKDVFYFGCEDMLTYIHTDGNSDAFNDEGYQKLSVNDKYLFFVQAIEIVSFQIDGLLKTDCKKQSIE